MPIPYESTIEVQSRVTAGVTFRIRKVSLAGRIDLTRRIRELAARYEFLDAGREWKDALEAAEVAGALDRMYLEWGLDGIDGLTIDGEPATPSVLAERGSEALCREAAAHIRAASTLSGEEAKNFKSHSMSL